ncbi:Nidogen-1 [Chionoecetes opilio]|uniref:Nidogen-1 n=1 Tax=Chionoecetes opilio TaxID=41210 RepID=A0A8J5CRJ1_CHIOP|nr:Nidogen-1 [Chionoecetes opilio]
MEVPAFLLPLVMLALLAAPSQSVPKSYFYRYGDDAGDAALPEEDEGSSPEKGLRVPIVFFGQIYQSIFINSNGFVSFLTEIPNFFNVQFPLEYPIIAPFYSDVDARKAGTIWYRETSDTGTMSRSKTEVQQYFSSAADFSPTSAFIVTWDGVGPYNQRTDRINTYQLVLVTNGEETYALFHYADGGIQWLMGDGKNPSLPDARGQVGLVSGDGRFYKLKGSGSDQVRSLDKRDVAAIICCDQKTLPTSRAGSRLITGSAESSRCDHWNWVFVRKWKASVHGTRDQDPELSQMEEAFMSQYERWSNCGIPGVWIYRIGQLSLNENVQNPDINVDDVTSQEADAIQSCAVGGSLCHSDAVCIDHTPGFCCRCEDDYLGNGINCIPKGEPMRVTGKVIGNINGVKLTDSDLHSYVLTAEGRSYTAISRIPSQIGYDLQSITAIGTGIAWLFASPVNNVMNGFSTTGGSMNRTVEVDFPQTGHRVELQQQFEGLDVFNYVQVKTQITGSIPTIPLESKIEMNGFDEEYTRVKAGQLRARSSRIFRLKGQTIDTPFTVETTIDYDECEWRNLGVGGQETLRLKVPGNIFIQYDDAEEIVRYALSAKLAPLEEIDPCVEGRQECGENSQCVVDGDTYRCVCERGYEEVYDSTLNKGICLDLNECSTNRDNCHTNAICTNTPGSFICTCKPDFTGDGVSCEKVSPVLQQRSCLDYNICSPNAECVYDDTVRSFRVYAIRGSVEMDRHVSLSACQPYQPQDPQQPYQPQDPQQPYQPQDPQHHINHKIPNNHINHKIPSSHINHKIPNNHINHKIPSSHINHKIPSSHINHKIPNNHINH